MVYGIVAERRRPAPEIRPRQSGGFFLIAPGLSLKCLTRVKWFQTRCFAFGGLIRVRR